MNNQIRIIGGKWRSRKISFPDHQGLRPSSDRLRETLFNWLQPIIFDKTCLDVFAGSGALGFESLSRGALHVTMLEKSSLVFACLQKNADLLQGKNLNIIHTDALNFLTNTQDIFDIIFLDPPFQENLLEPCLTLIESRQLLKMNGRIYIERQKDRLLPSLNNWEILKEVTTSNIKINLVTYKK